MRRNKRKKTPRGRTIIKKLQGNTVLLPGGGRYKVGQSICFSGQGITPIKRKGKVGKVGYSIDDVSDLMDYKPEVGVEVGHGVGFGVGFEVGDWKTYTYDPAACAAVEPAAPSAWTSIRATCAAYVRELWDALRWFFALPLRCLPDVGGPATPAAVRDVPPLDSFQPAPVADVPAPADVPPAEIPAACAARPKRKRKPRKD